MTAPAASESARRIFLDIIRYLLSTIVVVGHSFGFFLGYFEGFFPAVFPHPQSIAVVCFFFLSGYLIVGSQLSRNLSGRAGLTAYLSDRFIRIYLTLIPSLVFVVVADWCLKHLLKSDLDLLHYNTGADVFVKNLLLLPSMPYGTMRPIWSLMYEWWIYLLFGGLYFFRSDRILGGVLIAAGLYYTLFVNAPGEAGHLWIVWAFGGFCAWMQQSDGFLKRLQSAPLLAIPCLFIGSLWGYAHAKDAYNLVAGILLCASLFLVVLKVGRGSEFLLPFGPWSRFLAGYSFTLFLTHYTVLIWTQQALRLDGWAGVLAGFILSNIVAALIAIPTELRLASVKRLMLRRSG